MKKLNLIKRLWTDSHEKQSPQRFGRYAAMLLLLMMCVTHAWAYNEYNKKILYIDATACSWYEGDGCKPSIDIYDEYACTTKKAYSDSPGDITTRVWYFDLSSFYTYWQYSRGFKVERHTGSWWGNSVQAGYVDGDTHNCFKINSNSEGMSWEYYRPPMTSASVVDNGTSKTGSGTSLSPYQVVTGSTIYLSASCVSSVDDPSMTKEYKYFNKGNQLRDYSSTGTYSFTAGDAGTTYQITVKAKNTYQSGSGTESPASDVMYYTVIAAPQPSITALSVSAGDVYSGEGSLTLTATRNAAAAGINIQYQVKVPGGSWTNIGSAVNSTTKSYSPTSGHGTYEFRAYPVGYSSNYTDASKDVYEHWNIYVHDVQGWGKMSIYSHTAEAHGIWPGTACSKYNGSNSWYEVTLDSKSTRFILNKNGEKSGGNDIKTDDLTTGTSSGTYAAGTYWYINNNTGGTLVSVSVTDPTVTLSASVAGCNNITLNGNVTNFGGDGTKASDMKEVYFQVGGAKQVATTVSSSNGTFSKTISSASAGATNTLQAFAINIHGTGSSSTLHYTNVTLNLHDGAEGTTSVTAVENTAMPAGATAPSKTGYTFDGYYASAGGSGKKYYTNTMASANTWDQTTTDATIHAKWIANPYTITLKKHNGGSDGSVSVTFDANTGLTSDVAVPTKTGYTFAGYWTGEGGTGTKLADGDGKWQKGNAYISAGGNWVNAGNVILHAAWDANEYTITLDNQYSVGEGSPGTHMDDPDPLHYIVTFDTDRFDHYMMDAPSHGHYTFMGYWSAAGGAGTQILSDRGELLASTPYTDAEGKWTYPNNVTIYAKWSENQELNKNAGVTAGATHGAITLTYNSSAVSGYTASTRRGYLLDGYFTAASDGNEVITNTGVLAAGPVTNYIADGKWIYENASAPSIFAQWTPVTYTVRFAKNTDASYLGVETGTDPDNIAATYDAAITLPANPYTRPGYEFLGWAKAQYKAKGSYNAEYPLSDYQYASGEHNYNISATQDSIAVLYPKWVGNVYTVSFNPRGASVYPKSMNVRYGETYGSGNSGSLPEPSSVPTGKTFVGWFTSAVGGTQVTAETQLRTIGAHTLYAHYEDLTQVYFKNTIGWDEVYVTYAAYWDTYSTPSKGTGNNGRIYHKMRLVPGTSDVYYDQVPAAIVASWADGNEKIAFNDRELLTDKDKQAPTTGDYDNYNVGEVVYRMDFDSRATMFVPTNNKGTTADGNYVLNDAAQYRSTGYKEGTSSNPEYTSGYWMIFNNTYSGYLFSYQKNGSGDFSAEYGLNGAKAGDSVFVYSVKMDANTRYDLRIRKDCQTTNTKSRQFRYGTQITSGACTDLKLVCDPNNNSWMQTTAAGEYKFILTTKSDGHMYLTVEYPLAVNDYRVLYSYDDGSAKQYASEVIKPIAKDTVDTISVFVHKLLTPVVSRSMKIQQCTNIDGSGNPTWSDVAGGTINLTDVTANGVYDFAFEHHASSTPTGALIGKYDGVFYIRTASSDGGWDQYKDRADNVMTYSAYSMTQTLSEPYSHYYCHYIGSTSTDITFAIATKYSPNISGTMTGDATIGNEATTLPANANVRFSWNEETNAMARAYIKDAQGPSNTRFLVMHGADDDMIFNPDGSGIADAGSLAANELQFDDKGDWVYQVMLQAKPGAQVSIIAKYGSGEGVDRYLVGGPSSFETIMGGEGSKKYTIMAVYDFKTNRLMNAWTPDGTITDQLTNVDMMWIRYKQNSAQQITFSGSGSLKNVKAVGAIELRYNDLVGKVSTWDYDSRQLLRYFISFPFDVNVSDIFGLHGAELGREFVIRKYDGAERAKKGFYAGDGDTYWIDLTLDSVMHANEGYSLVFDNEYMNGDLGTIWENKTGGSSVYLYFPAAAKIASIGDANKTVTIKTHTCTNTKTFDYKGQSVSHANSDSHWNLIGSPLFVNSYVYDSDGTNGQTGTAAKEKLESYYEYDVSSKLWISRTYYSGGSYYACKAMHAMLVQFAGTVTWSKDVPSALSAPARERKETTVTNQLITLNLLQNGEDGDHMYIKMDENGNSDFVLCEDLFKIDNTKIPNIFSYASGNPVAYNKVAIESQTINLGVDIRKNGTYTFEMPDNVAAQVILVDNFDGSRTNLNMENYEVDLSKGNYYDRFSVEINVNKMPTAIDGTEDGSGSLKDGKAHKFIMNDMMYILNDGVLYDATGKRVK